LARPKTKHRNLKTFGSRVCVKQSGNRRCKLDHNNFTEIFLGYTATTQNITYLDLTSGIVKSSHHAIFDEAWYLQPAVLPLHSYSMTLAWRLTMTSSHPAARPPLHKPTYPPHGHPCAPHRAHPTTRNSCLHLRRHSTLPSHFALLPNHMSPLPPRCVPKWSHPQPLVKHLPRMSLVSS
jgi:hypothetical protein